MPASLRATFFACVLLAACQGPPAVERDPVPLLQTDSLRYQLVRHEMGYSARIVYAFRNETGVAVEVPGCGGDTRPMLQKERNGGWFDAWEPFGPRCTEEGIVIPVGATFRDTLDVFGAPPGSNVLPAFVFPEVEGVYRLFWVQARPAEGDPLTAEGRPALEMRYRVSNPFVLRR